LITIPAVSAASAIAYDRPIAQRAEGLARPAAMRCSLICCIRRSLGTAPTTRGLFGSFSLPLYSL
jgi:hypothetical protein